MPAPLARGGQPPLIVIEAPPGAVDRAAADLRAAGHELRQGFKGPAPRLRPCVRVGVVADAADAADALLAAIAGAGLLVEASADRVTIDRLVDDLRRLGPVDHRILDAPDPGPAVPAEARAILGMLAEGYSLGEAAAILGLARRTADRRLEAARQALGVTRTTEAIARARRLGWLRTGGG
jgi:DNA-binding NarL/FixJ family response regulator